MRQPPVRALIIGAFAVLLAGCSLVASSPPEESPQPRLVVSLTFNDGHASQYHYAGPILAAHRLLGTFYVVSSWIDGRWPCCMAWWQVDELYRAGHEIGGMGLDHQDLTRVSAASWRRDLEGKRRQVCGDRDQLSRRGYDPYSFAYPGGAFVAAFPDGSTPQDIVRSCGYRSGRAVGGIGPTTSRRPMSLPPPDPYALRTSDSTRRGPHRLSDLTAVVTSSARQGGWLPIAFDRVCHRGTADFTSCMVSPRSIQDTTLAAFVDWLAAAGRPGGAPAGTVVKTVRAALGAGEQPPLPPRPTTVTLTFDDGSRSQYAVRSVLLDYGMQATFYINSPLVDRRDGSAMTWEQLRELAADGNDIGGHTLTHPNLVRLRASEREKEICADRRRLLANGLHPVSFAYPYGLFDAATAHTVRSCGYLSARTSGSLSPGGPLYASPAPPADPYATPTLSQEREGPQTLSYLQSAVRAAAAHGGGWLQVVFHQVCRSSDRDYAQCMRSHRPVDFAVLSDFLYWLRYSAPPATSVKTVRAVLNPN